MFFQALPKFMAPRHIGLTCTAAVGASTRWRASKLLGGAGGGAVIVICIYDWGGKEKRWRNRGIRIIGRS